jgi:hypothetical protein
MPWEVSTGKPVLPNQLTVSPAPSVSASTTGRAVVPPGRFVAADYSVFPGPLSSSRRNPSSSSTGTPSSIALSYFDPGASPATT